MRSWSLAAHPPWLSEASADASMMICKQSEPLRRPLTSTAASRAALSFVALCSDRNPPADASTALWSDPDWKIFTESQKTVAISCVDYEISSFFNNKPPWKEKHSKWMKQRSLVLISLLRIWLFFIFLTELFFSSQICFLSFHYWNFMFFFFCLRPFLSFFPDFFDLSFSSVSFPLFISLPQFYLLSFLFSLFLLFFYFFLLVLFSFITKKIFIHSYMSPLLFLFSPYCLYLIETFCSSFLFFPAHFQKVV